MGKAFTGVRDDANHYLRTLPASRPPRRSMRSSIACSPWALATFTPTGRFTPSRRFSKFETDVRDLRVRASLGDLKTTFEFELFGTGVDEGQTTFRLRHAYGELGAFGAGQTWSPFMDPDVFPNSLEYWGPTGMVFFRNVQVRWMPIQGDRSLTLALELRSQISGAVGPRLVNSNRAQLTVGAGLAFNDERGVDVDPTQDVEALFVFRWSFYTYDRPKTNLDVSAQYYPSLSNFGRQRIQFDAGVKREFWKDVFLSLSMYNTFDSRPPNPEANTNDVGVVMSVGWSY